MKKQIGAIALVLGLVLGVANPAAAYVGPGAGLSLLGAFWGLALAVGAALGFVILWPLRRMLKRGKGKPAQAEVSHDGSSTSA